MSRTAIVWKIGDEGRGQLPGAEDAERPARRLDRDRRRRERPHRAGTRAAPRRPRPRARTRRARCPSRDRAGPRRPRSTRLCAMPTGMPTMTAGDDDPPEDRPGPLQGGADGDRPGGLLPAEDGRRHRLALDPGDDDADPGQGDEQPVPDAGAALEQAPHLGPGRVDRDDLERERRHRERPDRAQHDGADVERRTPHVVRRSGQEVEAGADQPAVRLDGGRRRAGVRREQPGRAVAGARSAAVCGVGSLEKRRLGDRWRWVRRSGRRGGRGVRRIRLGAGAVLGDAGGSGPSVMPRRRAASRPPPGARPAGRPRRCHPMR